MNIVEYHELSKDTAIYPHPIQKDSEDGYNTLNYIYPAIGLANEALELLETMGTDSSGDLEGDRTDVLGEAGDVLWYAHSLMRELCIDPAILEGDVEYNDSDDVEMVLIESSKTILNCTKKAMRDFEGVIEIKYYQMLENSILKIYGQIYNIADLYGVDLDYIRQSNYDKLQKRKDKGTLSAMETNGKRKETKKERYIRVSNSLNITTKTHKTKKDYNRKDGKKDIRNELNTRRTNIG